MKYESTLRLSLKSLIYSNEVNIHYYTFSFLAIREPSSYKKATTMSFLCKKEDVAKKLILQRLPCISQFRKIYAVWMRKIHPENLPKEALHWL